MLSFLARRIITVFLPTLLGISILVFGAMRLIPGNFVDVLIGVGPDVSQEQRDDIARSYGLDKPVPVQYLLWLGNTLTGDMGTSLRSGNPVAAEKLDEVLHRRIEPHPLGIGETGGEAGRAVGRAGLVIADRRDPPVQRARGILVLRVSGRRAAQQSKHDGERDRPHGRHDFGMRPHTAAINASASRPAPIG